MKTLRIVGALALVLMMAGSAVADGLDEARRAAYARIADARRAQINEGYVYQGIRFGTGDHARLMLYSAFQIAQSPDDEIDWKIRDGEWVTLKVGDAIAAWRETTLWIEQMFSRERQLDEKIKACRSAACIAAIKW